VRHRRVRDDAEDGGVALRAWYVRSTAISAVGNAMVHLVTTYVIYRLTSNLSITALVTTFAFIPSVLLAGVATRLVGRLGGARLFVLGGIGLTAASIIPLVASATGHLSARSLLLWQLIVGIIIGMVSPAGAIVTKMLAAPGRIPELNGRLTRVRAGGYLCGVAAGGLLYLAAGPIPIFAINSVSYIGPIAVVIVAMRHRAVPEATGRLRDLNRVHRREPAVRAVFAGVLIAAVAGCFTVGLPAVADSIGDSPIIYTVLKFVYPVGGLLVATTMARVHGQIAWGTVQQRCTVAAAVALVLLAVGPGRFGSPTPALLLAAALVAAVGFTVYLANSILSSLIQIAAPADSAGAVLTAYRMVPMLAIPFGQQLFGLIADATSVQAAMGAFAALLVVALLVGRTLHLRAALDAIDPIRAGTEPSAA